MSFQVSARLVVAALLLCALGLPWWHNQLDDLYITFSFAVEWWSSGELRHTNGERVEGYSSFLWVVLLVPVAALGLPPAVLTKLASLAAGLGLLAWFHKLLPRSTAGTLALFALAGWSSLARWSFSGMETTLATLLAAVGWVWVLRSREDWGRGMAVLSILALTRPEGLAYLSVGVLARLRLAEDVSGQRRSDLRWRNSDWLGVGALVFVGLYTLGRVAWFGHFWPTPYLAKIAASTRLEWGPLQLGGDLLVAAGLFVVVGLSQHLPRRSDLLWIAFPVAVHSWTLIRADGDWMGSGRLTLVGISATLAAWAALAAPRTTLSKLPWIAVPAIAATWLLDSGWPAKEGLHPRDLTLLSPASLVSRELETPFYADLDWMVENVPDGRQVIMGDVGMAGLVPGVRIYDTNGLVTREVAEILAGRAGAELLQELYEGADTPACIRTTSYDNRPPESLQGKYVEDYDLVASIPGEVRSNWYCLPDLPEVPAERVEERWMALHRLVPDQPFIRAKAETEQ